MMMMMMMMMMMIMMMMMMLILIMNNNNSNNNSNNTNTTIITTIATTTTTYNNNIVSIIIVCYQIINCPCYHTLANTTLSFIIINVTLLLSYISYCSTTPLPNNTSLPTINRVSFEAMSYPMHACVETVRNDKRAIVSDSLTIL